MCQFDIFQKVEMRKVEMWKFKCGNGGKCGNIKAEVPLVWKISGLIHLGNVPLFIMAILFGKKTGAIAGGVGMGLFDLLSGWTAWAPFTFIIVGIMGYVVGAMTEKHDQYGWKVAAIFVAFVIKIVGYYIAEIILYGNFIAPISSVPGNVVQIAVAAVVVLIVIEPIEIAVKKIGITQFA